MTPCKQPVHLDVVTARIGSALRQEAALRRCDEASERFKVKQRRLLCLREFFRVAQGGTSSAETRACAPCRCSRSSAIQLYQTRMGGLLCEVKFDRARPARLCKSLRLHAPRSAQHRYGRPRFAASTMASPTKNDDVAGGTNGETAVDVRGEAEPSAEVCAADAGVRLARSAGCTGHKARCAVRPL